MLTSVTTMNKIEYGKRSHAFAICVSNSNQDAITKPVSDDTARDYLLQMTIFMDFVVQMALDISSVALKDLALTLS